MGFFDRLKEGLKKTKDALVGRVQEVLKSFRKIDESLFEELEAALLQGDVGYETTMELVDHLRRVAKERRLEQSEQLLGVLQEKVAELLGDPAPLNAAPAGLTVIMVVGVNGVGKTTTIGKLAAQLKGQGKKVVLAAGDTFRAAAIDQLVVWGQRAGVEVIHGAEGGDPAAVAFDALQAARSRKADVLIVDTAGRLHNKANLMEELKKVRRVINREIPEAPHEVLLVVDATTGQNAVQQAKVFGEIAGVTGIALTKLDGTAKGGVVLAVRRELGIPVKLIGVGEKVEDLQAFDPQAFAQALFSGVAAEPET